MVCKESCASACAGGENSDPLPLREKDSSDNSRGMLAKGDVFGYNTVCPPAGKYPAPAQNLFYAGMAELADAPDLGSGGAIHTGSSPATRTIEKAVDFCRRSFVLPAFMRVREKQVL